MKKIKLFFINILCLLLINCGPVKSYPGPELPEEKLGFIRVDDTIPWASAYINNDQILGRGNSVLPGQHWVTVNKLTENSYDCISRNEFDSYGYDYCIRDRDEQIAKGKSARSCYTNDYTKRIDNCKVDKAQYRCQTKLKFEAGDRYEVQDKAGYHNPVSLFKSDNFFTKIDCKLVKSWTVREDRD